MRKATLLTLALSVSALFASAQSTTEAPSLKTFESGKVYSIKNVQQHKFAAAMPQTGDMACSSTLNLACLFTITPIDGSTGTYTIKPYADDTKVVYSIKVANADNTVGIKAADNDANTKWKIADAPDANYVTIISSNSTATNGYWNHRGTNADWNLSGIGGYTAGATNTGSFWTIAEVSEEKIAEAKNNFVNIYSTISAVQISDKLGYYSQALIDEVKKNIKNAADNKTAYNSAISLVNLVNLPVDGKVYNLYALQSDGTKNYPGGTEGKWVAQKLENNFYNFVNTTADKEGLKNWQGSNPKYSVSINQRKLIGALTLKIDGETNYLCVGSNGSVDRLNAGKNNYQVKDVTYSTDFMFEEATDYAGHPVTFTASTDGKAYATLNLPFATTIPAGVTAYKKVDGTESSVKLEVYKNEKEVLPANTPVLLQANEAGEKTFAPAEYKAQEATGFSGTLAAAAVKDANAYILAKDGEAVKFCKLNATNNQVNANKAYFTLTAAAANALNFDFGGVTTGIENAVANKANNAPIYDLSGRRVMNAVRGGIYIQNGKKFVK